MYMINTVKRVSKQIKQFGYETNEQNVPQLDDAQLNFLNWTIWGEGEPPACSCTNQAVYTIKVIMH